MLIMIDGIDGSGKSTVVEAWKKKLTTEGNPWFDLKAHWQKTGGYPAYSELKAYDFIFSCEPTYAGIGKVIRDELIKSGRSYPAKSIAESYALDRLILYEKIIIPALTDNKCVVEDRGISTSLAYQPLSDKHLTPTVLAKLDGNKLALKYRPDHLVLLTIDATIAAERLVKRTTKQDDVIFERLPFQKKLARVFASSAYRSLFSKRGTKVHYLPAQEEIGIMQSSANELFDKLLAPLR